MFVGHFAVAFAAKPAAPRVSLATLIVAAALADILWIVFFVTGLERVEIAPGLMAANSLNLISVPFSHSLLMLTVWALLFGGLYFLLRHDARGAWVIGAAVVSHFVLGFWPMILVLTVLWLTSLRGDSPPSLLALAVIWHIAYPSGSASRFTNDLTDYSRSHFDRTADGKTLAIVSESPVFNLEVMDPANGSFRPLTTGGIGGSAGTMTWGGEHTLFYSLGENLFRRDLQDSMARQLTTQGTVNLNPSACGDGTLVYQTFTDDRSAWSPDGKSLQYLLFSGGSLKLWGQPLTEGPPREVMSFADPQIADFAWSHDGKQLAVRRGLNSFDIVLMSNFN